MLLEPPHLLLRRVPRLVLRLTDLHLVRVRVGVRVRVRVKGER